MFWTGVVEKIIGHIFMFSIMKLMLLMRWCGNIW